MITAVLLPGFGGRADQPILTRLERRLTPLGFSCLRLAPPRLPLSPELEAYGAWLDAALAEVKGPLVVVGRSFGGRLGVRLAARRKLAALVLLGFPIRPPGKRRPLDEAALSAVRVPTWVAQGSKDQLGPLRVLREVIRGTAIELFEVKGAGHSFGAREAAVLDATAGWLDRTVRGR